MKLKYSLFIGLIIIMLTGCSYSGISGKTDSGGEAGNLKVGHSLTIENIDSSFTLIDNTSTLAADGLYYVSWGIGELNTYGEGDDADELYDATLYLVLEEAVSSESAQENMNTWYEAALSRYDILEEKEIDAGGQTYTLISYNSLSGEPYNDHGVSVFGSFGNTAVCVELICCENFNEDLEIILTEFLENCTYAE